MKSIQLFSLLCFILFFGCKKEDLSKTNNSSDEIYGWLVPMDQLVIYNNRLDRIQSIDSPAFISKKDALVGLNEEVLVYQFGSMIKIYPVSTFWGNEIVNDQQDGHYYTVSFCPLTGSGVAWDREINDNITTFGVSGNLFNNNLVPYDRNSGSFWSQMKLKSIKGPLGDAELEHEFVLHTKYSTAISAFPEALILSDLSGHPACDSVCLPPTLKSVSGTNFYSDNYFGIISQEDVLLFGYELFQGGVKVLQTKFRSYSLIVVGSEELGFVLAFINKGNENYEPLNGRLPEIMKDSKGNVYDLFGNITKGPEQGQRLLVPTSYSAKKYIWELLFEETLVFQVSE
jgi:hypothetical protein